MKGVSFSVEFVVAIVLVAVITVLALSLLSPVAGFDIKNFFNLNFPGGEPGEYHEGEDGGGTIVPPSEVEKIISEGKDYYTISEVGCYIAKSIYDTMLRDDDNNEVRYNDEENLCYHSGMQAMCIFGGFGTGKIGYWYNEDETKLMLEGCRRCGDSNALDEACINTIWNHTNVSQLPFCGNWYSDLGNEVTFSNNNAYKNPNLWVNRNPDTCYATPSSTYQNTDRIVGWLAHPYTYEVDPYSSMKFREWNEMREISPRVTADNDPRAAKYIFYVVGRRAGHYQPEEDMNHFNIRFIVAPPNLTLTNNSFAFTGEYFKNPQYRNNDLGIWYPPARTVLDAYVILSQPVLVMDTATMILNKATVTSGRECYCQTNNYDGTECDHDEGTKFKPCKTKTTAINWITNCVAPDQCEGSEIIEFRTDWAFEYGVDDDTRWQYTDDRTSNLDPGKVDLNFENINLIVDRDQNGIFEPGVYRVIVRNWLDTFDEAWWDFAWGSDKVSNWKILYDRSVIIYKISENTNSGNLMVTLTIDGKPGAEINIDLYKDNVYQTTGKTDQNGHYTFQNLEYGGYSISVVSKSSLCHPDAFVWGSKDVTVLSPSVSTTLSLRCQFLT